jgi:hypothetical protein
MGGSVSALDRHSSRRRGSPRSNMQQNTQKCSKNHADTGAGRPHHSVRTPEFLTVASCGAPPDILLLFAALRAAYRKHKERCTASVLNCSAFLSREDKNTWGAPDKPLPLKRFKIPSRLVFFERDWWHHTIGLQLDWWVSSAYHTSTPLRRGLPLF